VSNEIAHIDNMCADCGGFDVEWMNSCKKHKGIKVCRACECPECLDDELDDENFDDGYGHSPDSYYD